jgi:outer membrane lipoprotein-sorting protein
MFRHSILVLAVLSGFTSALAGDGDGYLGKVDAQANVATDAWFRFNAVTQEPGKNKRGLVFEVQNMGTKRLVKFIAPSDMKGTRVLVLSRKQMWVYLPAYKKVRRVAGHVKQQGFMGTMYSDEDMSTSHYALVYEAQTKLETEETITLALKLRAGASSGYPKLEMDIHRDIMLPSQIRFFNKDGQHIKTEYRSDYDCSSKVCTPTEMKMVDHRRGDAWTTLTAEERRVNQGVSARIFSVRNLERGR